MKKKITARTDQGKTNSLTHVSCKQNCMLLKRSGKYQKVGCKKQKKIENQSLKKKLHMTLKAPFTGMLIWYVQQRRELSTKLL